MFKMVLKGVIFLMGIQSFIGKLEQQGIVSGSIKINFPVLYSRIVSILKSDEMNTLIEKVESTNVGDYVAPRELQAKERIEYQENRDYPKYQQYQETYQERQLYYEQNRSYQDQYREQKQHQTRRTPYITHRVRPGETLSNLADQYGISWKVIQKANHINNEHYLQIGQCLLIPRLSSGLG